MGVKKSFAWFPSLHQCLEAEEDRELAILRPTPLILVRDENMTCPKPQTSECVSVWIKYQTSTVCGLEFTNSKIGCLCV